MADASALGADLAEARRAEIARVDGDHGRTFRAAVALERADAEAFLKCKCKGFRQFFRAYYDELQAAEIFGQAATRVGLQKRGRRQEKRALITADQFAAGGEGQRSGMIAGADAEPGGKPERDGEAERMEEGQDAE